jgi:uncharacterized protein
MSEQFEVYQDALGRFRWRLKASNGEILASADSSYSTRVSCLHAIDVVKRIAASAPVRDLA